MKKIIIYITILCIITNTNCMRFNRIFQTKLLNFKNLKNQRNYTNNNGSKTKTKKTFNCDSDRFYAECSDDWDYYTRKKAKISLALIAAGTGSLGYLYYSKDEFKNTKEFEKLDEQSKYLASTSYDVEYIFDSLENYGEFRSSPVFLFGPIKTQNGEEKSGFIFCGEENRVFNKEAFYLMKSNGYVTNAHKVKNAVIVKTIYGYKFVDAIIAWDSSKYSCNVSNNQLYCDCDERLKLKYLTEFLKKYLNGKISSNEQLMTRENKQILLNNLYDIENKFFHSDYILTKIINRHAIGSEKKYITEIYRRILTHEIPSNLPLNEFKTQIILKNIKDIKENTLRGNPTDDNIIKLLNFLDEKNINQNFSDIDQIDKNLIKSLDVLYEQNLKKDIESGNIKLNYHNLD